MSILDDLKDKLFPPKYPSARYPIVPTVPPRPVPIAIPPNAPSAIAAEPTQASLVGTHNNSKGRASDTGSLVSGR